MPLLNYRCPDCKAEKELFDDESRKCRNPTCSGMLEVVVEGTVSTAATTNLYENRHTYYDSTPSKAEWNRQDTKRLDNETQGKRFQEGLKKL